jgi:hypothetical protein
LGIHVPLIGMTMFMFASFKTTNDLFSIFLWLLFFTLLATGIALYFLNKRLIPLIRTEKGLKGFYEKGIIPDLPTYFTDGAVT